MPDDQTLAAAQVSAPAQQIVIFATPSLTHQVSLEYKTSWTQTVWLLSDRRIPQGVCDRGGDQFVAKVRNKLVHQFLADYPMATDLFWLDDDIGWPAEKVAEFLARPEAIVAGVYPKKSEEVDFPVELAADRETGALYERDGLVRALSIPFGFVRIKRAVLEQLAAGAQVFHDQEPGGVVGSYPAIFESGVGSDGWWWGEDYTFCRKWADLGGEIWVDPSITFSHRGHRRWTNTLGDHLETYRQRAADGAAALAADMSGFDLNTGAVVAG